MPGLSMTRLARHRHMRWLAVFSATVALLAVVAWVDVHTVGAQAEGDDLLHITSRVTYVVRPEAGPVHVSWQVDIENNDPSTQRQNYGTSYFYHSIGLPVLRGASAISATGSSGAPLAAEVDDSAEGPTVAAIVYFDRALFYGEHYGFTLSYDLAAARSDVLLVTSAYVYLPAIAVGDSSTVRITVPHDRDWDVTLEPFDCPESDPGEYVCGASDSVQVAAWVEVTRPDALQSTDSAVQLTNGEITLTISYFPGEESWASHTQDLSDAALPVLEGLFGFPYQGPTDLTIAERGRQDIAGYEGTFGCLTSYCVIGITPIADDSTALHELAHLWTEMFDARWLAEGLAEFMSDRAAADLAPLVSASQTGPPPRTVDLYLDEWGATRYMIGAGEDVVAREQTGYWESERFFETLEKTIGLPALQAANAAAADLDRGIDSRTYLDLLEEVSGARLDDLFLEQVFPPSFAPILEQRRRAHEQLIALRADAAEAELHLRERPQELIDAWDFDEAIRDMDEAEAALDAYMDARDRLDEPRSLWQKIGLWGQDPTDELDASAAEFSVGRFADATKHAEEAAGMVDGAERAGQVRLLAAIGVVAAVILVAGGSLWFVRRRSAR